MSEKKSTAQGRFLIILSALLWGLAGVCVKSISWGALPLIAARSLLSLPILLFFKGGGKLKVNRTNLLGAVMMSATGMLYVQAIKLTTAGTAIVLQYIAPILVFLFTVLFRGRKASAAEIAITAAVFVGIVLSFSDSLNITSTVGNILALLSGFTFAGQIIVMSEKGSDSSDCLIISCLISLAIALPFAIGDSSVTFDTRNVLWVLALGIFQYGLANALFGKGIKKAETVEASLLLTLEPIFNPIPVALFCEEMMGTNAIIGSVIVIVALAVYGLLPKPEKAAASEE